MEENWRYSWQDMDAQTDLHVPDGAEVADMVEEVVTEIIDVEEGKLCMV